MAGFLAAIGQAAPAISGAFKDYLDEAKNMREEARRDEEFKMRQEQFATNQEGAKVQQAISSQTLANMKREEAKAKEQEQKDNTPMDITPIYKSTGMNPEFMEFTNTFLSQYGVKNGMGRAKDVREGVKALTSNPLFVKQVEGQVDYVNSAYQNARMEYEKIKGKGNFEKEQEAYAKLKGFEKQAMAWGGVKANIRQREQDAQSIQGFLQDLEESGELAAMQSTPGGVKALNEIRAAAKLGKIDLLVDAYKNFAKEKAGKTEKKIERTIDLGDRVEIHYTDGTVETKARGATPKAGAKPEDKDAGIFRKAIEDVKKFEGGALFMTKLSEAEEERAESKRRQKAKSNYLARGGDPKKFDSFWQVNKPQTTGIDKSDIDTLKSYANPEMAKDHVERAYRANMISREVMDQAIGWIEKNRKQWGKK